MENWFNNRCEPPEFICKELGSISITCGEKMDEMEVSFQNEEFYNRSLQIFRRYQHYKKMISDILEELDNKRKIKDG